MQQRNSKYFAHRYLSTLGKGSIGQSQPFQNMVMFHIKVIVITKCSNMVANILYFACRYPPPPLPPLLTQEVKRSKFYYFFSEQYYVAYQTKGNYECSNSVANILPTDTPPPWGGKVSIGQKSTFSEHGHVAYQIKRNHEMQQHGRNMR